MSTNDVLLTHHYADFSAGPEGDEKSFPKNVVGSIAELLVTIFLILLCLPMTFYYF